MVQYTYLKVTRCRYIDRAHRPNFCFYLQKYNNSIDVHLIFHVFWWYSSSIISFEQILISHFSFTSYLCLIKDSFTHGRRTGSFFSKFCTVRFSQRWFYYHLKIFKKYEFSQNLKVVVQKQRQPCPFQFWTSQGRGSPFFKIYPWNFITYGFFIDKKNDVLFMFLYL